MSLLLEKALGGLIISSQFPFNIHHFPSTFLLAHSLTRMTATTFGTPFEDLLFIIFPMSGYMQDLHATSEFHSGCTGVSTIKCSNFDAIYKYIKCSVMCNSFTK